MSVYKFGLVWNQSIVGVDENWLTGDVSASVAAQQLQTFLFNRFQLAADQQFPVGVRVSVYGSKRRSTVLRPGGRTPFPGTASTTAPTSKGIFVKFPLQGDQSFMNSILDYAPVRNVLQYTCEFSNGRTSQRYLSGVPRTLLGSEPQAFDPKADPAWFKNFRVFASSITKNGWQIEAWDYVNNPEYPIVDLVSQAAAPSELGLVINGTSNIAPQDKLHVHNVRAQKGTRGPTLNGYWVVHSVDTTTIPTKTIYFLRGSDGTWADTLKLQPTTTTPPLDPNGSTLRRLKKTLYPVISIGPNNAFTTHKRGNGSLRRRGRRSILPTLDP